MPSSANIFVGPTEVFIGTAGSEPTTSLGFNMEKATKFTASEENLVVKVDELLGQVKEFAINPSAMIKCGLLEGTIDNLERAFPAATRSGDVISRVNTNTTIAQCSVKIVGVTPAGLVRTYKMLYAQATLTGDIEHGASTLFQLNVEFHAITVSGVPLWTIEDALGTSAVTLSSGSFTRVAGVNYYRVNGEGSAADDFSTIAGSLTNGEIIIIQIAGPAITVKHLADTIELIGAADWLMDDTRDTLWLEYQTSGTQLVEVGRYDYPG